MCASLARAERGAIAAADYAAEFSNSFGSITVERLAGALSAQTQHAPITLRDAALLGATTSLRGVNSPIAVSIAEFGDARLEIHNTIAPVIVDVPRTLSARGGASTPRGWRFRRTPIFSAPAASKESAAPGGD